MLKTILKAADNLEQLQLLWVCAANCRSLELMRSAFREYRFDSYHGSITAKVLFQDNFEFEFFSDLVIVIESRFFKITAIAVKDFLTLLFIVINYNLFKNYCYGSKNV